MSHVGPTVLALPDPDPPPQTHFLPLRLLIKLLLIRLSFHSNWDPSRESNARIIDPHAAPVNSHFFSLRFIDDK